MNAIAASIYTTLAGGTALVSALGGTAIYQTQAPDEAALPYVVFNKQGGGPDNTNPSDMRNMVYYIRAYATSAKTAGAIDAQVEALLHKRTLSVTGYTNFYTVREQDLEFVDNAQDGTRVYESGALYRIRIDS